MSLSVLIIEDDLTDANRIVELLKYEQIKGRFPEHNVHRIRSVGADETCFLENNDFDIAIVDFELGSSLINGFEAIDLIRRRDTFYETKVIVFTGQATDIKDVIEGYVRGMFEYVIKDDLDRLLQALKRAIMRIDMDKRARTLSSFSDVRLREFMAIDNNWDQLKRGQQCWKGILFCDICNSTEIIQTLLTCGATNYTAASCLREFFTIAAATIQRYGGIVDKFIGDEIMAYFGPMKFGVEGPTEAEMRSCCESGILACTKLKVAFDEWWPKKEKELGVTLNRKPDVRMVYHYGSVVWATLGSDDYLSVSILTQEVVKSARLMQHRMESGERLIGDGEIWTTSVVRNVVQGLPNMDFGEETLIELRNFSGVKIPLCRVVLT